MKFCDTREKNLFFKGTKLPYMAGRN